MAHDADEILKIILPNHEEDDFVSWTLEKNDLFLVSSSYNLALDVRNGTPPNSSDIVMILSMVKDQFGI